MSTKDAGAGFLTAAMLSSPFGAVVVPTLVALLLAVSIMVALSKVDELDESEPRLMKSKIPLCGHLIGMLKWQVGYMQMLSSKVPSYSAFTLRIFSNRIYVICDPALIQAAYKNTKTFDFGQFVVESAQRAFDIGEQGMKIIRGETAPGYDPNGKFLNGNDGHSFLNENHKIMVESLSPGTGLSELNKGVLEKVAGFLNVIDREETRTFGLYRWIRDVLTLATADALYGEKSPLNHDSSLIDALWDFEENMTLLMLNFLPTFIAPKAYHGRLAIKAAFTKYYTEGHHLNASKLIRARLACCKKWGFSSSDIENFEISTLFLATTNSIPTSFWQLSYILSSPSLLSSIRAEVETIVTMSTLCDGTTEATMDISNFQTSCPLLLSTFHETLRLVDAATSVRAVTAPTTLTSSTSSEIYHLKAPAVVQLPSGITHTSPLIWGPSAQSFDPTRFLPSTKAALPKHQRRQQTQAYFPFGGGKHLCPGRHFAMMEILAFVAATVVGYDVQGLEGGVPERAFQKLGTAVRKPVSDVDVKMKRRHGWEGVRWKFGEGSDGVVDFEGLVGEGSVSEDSD